MKPRVDIMALTGRIQRRWFLALALLGAMWITISVSISAFTDSRLPEDRARLQELQSLTRSANQPESLDRPSADSRHSESLPDRDQLNATKLRPGSTRLSANGPIELDLLESCLSSVPVVEQLALDGSALVPAVVRTLAAHNNVDALTIYQVHSVPPDSLPIFRELSGLNQLTLHEAMNGPAKVGPQVFQRIISSLCLIDGLKSVETGHWFPITDAILLAIGQSRSIDKVLLRNAEVLSRVGSITIAGISGIGRMERLQTVRLEGFASDGFHNIPMDRALGELLSLPSLRYLALPGWDIGDQDVAPHIGTLRNLRVLDLRWTRVSDRTYAQIDETWGLTELLVSTEFGDAGAEAIGSLKGLRRLSCVAAQLTSDGLSRIIKQCSTLIELHVSYCKCVRDHHLDEIRNMPQLTTLGLAGVPHVSGDSVYSMLHGAARLRVLDLTECNFVREEFVRRLLDVSRLTRLYVFQCSELPESAAVSVQSEYDGVALISHVPFAH